MLPLGDVKSHLSELVSRVHGHHERVTVTVHGGPSAVLIAPDDLERLEEALEIMRDVAMMNRLAESDAEQGRLRTIFLIVVTPASPPEPEEALF